MPAGLRPAARTARPRRHIRRRGPLRARRLREPALRRGVHRAGRGRGHSDGLLARGDRAGVEARTAHRPRRAAGRGDRSGGRAAARRAAGPRRRRGQPRRARRRHERPRHADRQSSARCTWPSGPAPGSVGPSRSRSISMSSCSTQRSPSAGNRFSRPGASSSKRDDAPRGPQRVRGPRCGRARGHRRGLHGRWRPSARPPRRPRPPPRRVHACRRARAARSGRAHGRARGAGAHRRIGARRVAPAGRCRRRGARRPPGRRGSRGGVR